MLTIVAGAIYPYMKTPETLLSVGFVPTEVRLRANGLCNMLGRGATVVSPFIVLSLFKGYGVAGMIGLMIALLIVQIVVVATMGIETNRRGLEALTAKA